MSKSAFKLIHKLIHPQNAAKLTKIHGSELGVKLWCHLTPQVHCTTTVPQMYNCHKVILENLLSVWLLVHTNLFIPSHFWTTCTKFDSCCWHYVATCRNIFVQVHIYVLSPKPLQWNFIKIFLLSIRSGAHKLFRPFLDFSQFLIAILQKLWRHLATKMRTI